MTRFAESIRELAPAVDKVRKAEQQIFKNRPRFPFPQFDEHHTIQEGGLRPIGGHAAGALQPSLACAKSPAARATRAAKINVGG